MLNFNIYFIFVLISKNSLLYSNTESLFTFFLLYTDFIFMNVVSSLISLGIVNIVSLRFC